MSTSINENDLDPAVFTANVTSLTHSFGDNTRRKIYLYLRENPGATATELSATAWSTPTWCATTLSVSPSRATSPSTTSTRPRLDAPPRATASSTTALVMDGSMRRDALLVALLEMALERLGPEAAESMSHDVGVEYGRTLAGDRGCRRTESHSQSGDGVDRRAS